MEKSDFQIGIMHGHSTEYKKIKEIIMELKFRPSILIELNKKKKKKPRQILEQFRNLVWHKLDCVVCILTCDDFKKRARQNLVFELGYCIGAFDSLPDKKKKNKYSYHNADTAVIVCMENGVEEFTYSLGIKKISFIKGSLELKKEKIIKALNNSFKNVKKFYE